MEAFIIVVIIGLILVMAIWFTTFIVIMSVIIAMCIVISVFVMGSFG